jgi:hypothetical protein
MAFSLFARNATDDTDFADIKLSLKPKSANWLGINYLKVDGIEVGVENEEFSCF